MSSVVLGQNLLLNCGSEAQIATYLPSLMSGETTATVALDEGRFFNPDAVATSDASGLLNGRKDRVLDAGQSSYVFCIAEQASGDRGVALFASSAEGVSIDSRRTMDLHSAGSILLDGVPAEDTVWLAGDDVEAGIQQTIDQATIVLAAEMMGSAREVLERTVAYLGEREQFDVKLATFQALQHRCAHMYCELELAESAVSAALTALDQVAPNVSLLASSAKALANDCFTLISSEAVQLHGGMGVTEEMDIGLFLKRSRVCNQLLGTSSYHRDRFARLRGF
jgi:alkylation response protein AidB-like acyl-CoA dehydrogenase